MDPAPRLGRAALAYARMGWPVLPLVPYGKEPLGYLVPHGLEEATTDEATILRWWSTAPDANVGLRTGVAFDVLDIDDQSMALPALAAAAGGPFTFSGPRVRTPNGWHLYLAPTGAGNRTGMLEGCDWRGKGGYVVAPPSVHPSGWSYRWDPYRERIPEAPRWLLDAVKPPEMLRSHWTRDARGPAHPVTKPAAYADKALRGEIDRVLRAKVHTRNDTLNVAAFKLGRLVGAGVLKQETVEDALLRAGLQVGLGEQETRRTIHSGLSKGMMQPRLFSAGLV